MKRVILLISLLIILVNNLCKSQPFTVDYIKIEPTGLQTFPRQTMLISKEKLNIGLMKQWLFGHKLESLTDDQKQKLIDIQYICFVTDSNTFAVIAKYIKENQQYYTNSEHKNWGDLRDYSITLNGKRYDIYCEMSADYFDRLIKILVDNKCDKQIIETEFRL